VASRPVRALTDLDDARACEPLDGGVVAVATGGGLAFVGRDGVVRVLTALEGLPDTRVHAIAPTPEGDALWTGTEGGAALVSLAGGLPRVVSATPGPPVQAVHVAAGSVYFGTRGAGVLRLRPGAAFPERVPSAVPGTRAVAIADRDATVYVAYADGPLARLAPGETVIRALAGSPTHGQALAVAGAALVLGDLEGLYRVDADGFAPLASVDARGLAGTGATLLVAADGVGLETGTAQGALREASGVSKLARGVGVRGDTVCVATAEGLFVGRGRGAFRRVALGGPPSNDITALAISPSGRVAVGTFENGAVLYEDGEFHRVPGVGGHENVNGMAWQGERLWLATAHGLVRVSPDGTVGRFASGEGLPSTVVRAVHVVSDHRVLVGTDAGPAIVDGDRVVPLGEPTSKRGAVQSLASPMHATYAVGSSENGTLYIGTTAGLYYGTAAGGFRRASLAAGELEDDWVTAIATDGADVYVGTYSKGITRLRFPPGATRPVPAHLGGGYVNSDGLALARGKLWASTMEGPLVRDLAGDGAHWEGRTALSPGRDVTAIRFSQETMWIASRRGLAVLPHPPS
jgi:ligand-binding sensor domain-containing protein